MRQRPIDVLVPFWGLAGGVIKVLDYADHARVLGLPVRLWAPAVPNNDDLIWSLPVAQRLLNAPGVTVGLIEEMNLDGVDTILFTDPSHHELIERATSAELGDRVIHLVQGTRHANPQWQGGRNYRLLHRPMTRVSVSHQVTEVLAPLVNTSHRLHTIVEGHDVEYFSPRPTGTRPESAPLRVFYTTWKSDLGDRVRKQLSHTDEASTIAWIKADGPLGWPALRNRYHGADVFLAAPGPEEGFYLPGLEAMAAGVAVVTALVGGNAAYVHHGDNALVAEYDDPTAHAEALLTLKRDPGLVRALVENGRATTKLHHLDRERSEFADVLATVGH